ncbi:MAG TPA: AAA family ATPase [Burkholderiales bacterium]|nr:AAA family ATPase [Burkholderiales bacterium]
MYCTFFGLKRPPFARFNDVANFFDGARRGAILETMRYAVTQGDGVFKLTGEVGSGKTMLCRVLQEQLKPELDITYIAAPSLPPGETIHAIACQLGAPIPGSTNRAAVLQALNTHLVARHRQDRPCVLIIEECQRMPVDTLEEIRLLGDLEVGGKKRLQLVLLGEPAFDQMLRRPALRALTSRIIHGLTLPRLAGSEVAAYLSFRIRRAGYCGPDLFPPVTVDAIARASQGLPRRIGLIADKTLLAAFAENTHMVRPRHVRVALRDGTYAGASRWSGWLPWASVRA